MIVMAWLLVIFGASSDSASSNRSSRIIGPIVRWLYPQAPPEQVQRVVFVVRKAAHVTEYAILAWLLLRALRASNGLTSDHRWNRKLALWAWGLATLYAMSDELHQRFVPGRTGQWEDVAIDSAGAALGLFLVWAVASRRKSWRRPDAGRSVMVSGRE